MEKILAVIDDHGILLKIREIFSERLPDIILNIVSKENDGLEFALKQLPDLILVDNLSGFKACHKIRPIKKYNDIPILFIISQEELDDTLDEALKLGVNGFIFKPIRPSDLIAQLRIFQKLKTSFNELGKSEERFVQVAKSSGIWVWEVDINGKYTYCSDSEESILGYTPNEIIGQKYFYDFFTPDIKEELKNAAFDVFDQKASFNNFINPNLHKNGSIVIMETSGVPILDEAGNLTGYLGVDKDISERIRYVDDLKMSVAWFNAILESTAEGILVVDQNEKITHFNNKIIELLEVPERLQQKGMDVDNLAFVIKQLKNPEKFLQKTIKTSINDEESSYEILEFKDGRVLEQYSKPQRIGGKWQAGSWAFMILPS